MLHLNTIACYCDLMLLWRTFFSVEILESLGSSLFKWRLDSTWCPSPFSHILNISGLGALQLPQSPGFFCTFRSALVYYIILQHFEIKNRGFHALRLVLWPFKLRGRTVCQNHDRLHVSIHLSKFIKGKFLQLSKAEHKFEGSKTQSQK